jgi:HSP20 family protein
MQELEQALEETRALHQKVLGQPAPDLAPQAYLPFPPGVDPIRTALAEVAQLKELWERARLMPRPASWIPPADVLTTGGELVVRLEIPGISREDVKVLFVGNECIVRGERKAPAYSGDPRPLAIERPWGPFERRFPLPAGARAAGTKARMASGLLELRIPLEQLEPEREQKIDVE